MEGDRDRNVSVGQGWEREKEGVSENEDLWLFSVEGKSYII